jgi:hypothetical protein
MWVKALERRLPAPEHGLCDNMQCLEARGHQKVLDPPKKHCAISQLTGAALHELCVGSTLCESGMGGNQSSWAERWTQHDGLEVFVLGSAISASCGRASICFYDYLMIIP